jgi:hypothetical protein
VGSDVLLGGPRTARGRPAGAAGAERSLSSYLLLPRPGDLVKALILPLTFALATVCGTAAGGDLDPARLARAAVVWVALEALLYQARYQWNDARGFRADREHPDRAERGRLPEHPRGARWSLVATWLVTAGRLVAAALLVVLLPGLDLAGPLAAVAIGVFVAAVPYEYLRSRGTGRSDQVPVPLTPSIIGLWVAVGAGYAVRGVAGLGLAVDLSGRPALTVAAVVGCWALGIAFVTSRWVLETMTFARVEDGTARWRAGRHHAREHTLALVRWLGPEPDPRDLPAGAGLTSWRALRGSTSWWAPWNLAAVTAGAAAAVTGQLLAAPGGDATVLAGAPPGGGAMVLAGAGGAVAAAVVTRVQRRRAAAAAALAVLLGAALPDGPASPGQAVLPWLAAMLIFASCTGRCADDLGRPARLSALLLGSGRRPDRRPGRAPNQVPSGVQGRAPDPAPSGVQGPTPNPVPSPVPRPMRGRVPGRAPSPGASRMRGRLPGRVPGGEVRG